MNLLAVKSETRRAWARAAYIELTDLQQKAVTVSALPVRTDLSNFLRGRRKRVTTEMASILAEWAAWTGQLPEEESLRQQTVCLIAEWNSQGEFAGSYKLGTLMVSTLSLASSYLGSIGFGAGARKRTAYKGMSTDALDAAARILREICPEKWYVANGELGQKNQRTPSKAERWLLSEMRLIDDRVDAAVVKAMMERSLR